MRFLTYLCTKPVQKYVKLQFIYGAFRQQIRKIALQQGLKKSVTDNITSRSFYDKRHQAKWMIFSK